MIEATATLTLTVRTSQLGTFKITKEVEYNMNPEELVGNGLHKDDECLDFIEEIKEAWPGCEIYPEYKLTIH